MPKKQRREHNLCETAENRARLQAFAKNCREYRQRNDLSLKEVAEAVGISQNQLGHIERGENAPTVCVYFELVKYYEFDSPLPLTVS